MSSYVPEEEARTALGMARAMTRGDIEGARHLWDTSERQDLLAMGLAVLLANLISRLSETSGQPPEQFYGSLQQGIEDTRGR